MSLRAAVIGSGPSGFYSAAALLRCYPDVRVDILERLPVPFGLIRYGVAPDHPQTKNAISGFSQFMEKNRNRVRFLGNVQVMNGTGLSMEHLHRFYDIAVNASGASHPRSLPGVQLPQEGVYSAHDFILWLNGHPDVHAQGDLVSDENSASMPSILTDSEEVCVIGNGNVAIDVARILLRPVDDLTCTDISPSALEVLARTSVKSVNLIGRRCPSNASWTTAALREIITKIPGIVTSSDHDLIHRDETFLSDTNTSRMTKRSLKLLKDKTVDINDVEALCGDKHLRLQFLLETGGIRRSNGKNVIDFVQNEPVYDEKNEAVSIQPTEKIVTHCYDAAFLSLGYVGGRGEGIRVGWANESAKGIIGDNKLDADTIISRLGNAFQAHTNPEERIDDWFREENWEVIDWDGWKRIDEEEKRRGRAMGRAPYSAKLETVGEMMEAAR